MSENLVNKIFLLRNNGSRKYLNVWGIDQVGNNRNVNQYDLSAELSQLFWVQKTSSGVYKLSSVIMDSEKHYYSLNINGNTNNANLFEETSTNDVDSALTFEQVQSQDYRIALKDARKDGSTLYLTAIGNSNGTSSTGKTEGNVIWAAKNDDAYQIWNLEFVAEYSDSYDLRKLDAQLYLRKFYGSDITIDARAGTALCTELIKALQKIVLNIQEDATGYGSFGPATLAACPTLVVGMKSDDKTKELIKLFCHALFCKGYSPTAIYDTYNEKVESGAKHFQIAAGLESDGIITPLQMKAVFNTDSYKLAFGTGDSRIQGIQQNLNRFYYEYSGVNPCDGIYSRATNNAMIYAIQKEEGISVEDSAPSFGKLTFDSFPTLPFTGDPKEIGRNEVAFTKILQYALYVNGYYDGAFDGKYNDEIVTGIKSFQKFMAYPEPHTEYVDARVMKGLLASCGDQSRSCLACDTATILNTTTATALFNAGYRYVGRYLTGTVRKETEDGQVYYTSKALTRGEIKLIHASGLSIIPIYQDGGERAEHFSRSRGKADAEKAYVAAKQLGIPNESTIYFAVDFDAMGSDVKDILAYFSSIKSTLQDYSFGVYGTRNICSQVMEVCGAEHCYVSDMSTGYSGNLSYKMPSGWAFDQFAPDVVAGVEIDKVAVSGVDCAVRETSNHDLNNSEFIDTLINSAVHSKICDFQEDLPILLVPLSKTQLVPESNGSNMLEIDNEEYTDILNSLPNLSYGKKWHQIILDDYSMRIEYEVAVGASTAHSDSAITFSVSNGSISVSDKQKITDEVTMAQSGSQSFPIKPEQVTKLFERMSTSIKFGSIEMAFIIDVNKLEATVEITCSIPNLYVSDDMTVNFSQTISVTLKAGTFRTSDKDYVLSFEDLKEKLSIGKGLTILTQTLADTSYKSTDWSNVGSIAKTITELVLASALAVFFIITLQSVAVPAGGMVYFILAKAPGV